MGGCFCVPAARVWARPGRIHIERVRLHLQNIHSFQFVPFGHVRTMLLKTWQRRLQNRAEMTLESNANRWRYTSRLKRYAEVKLGLQMIWKPSSRDRITAEEPGRLDHILSRRHKVDGGVLTTEALARLEIGSYLVCKQAAWGSRLQLGPRRRVTWQRNASQTTRLLWHGGRGIRRRPFLHSASTIVSVKCLNRRILGAVLKHAIGIFMAFFKGFDHWE